MITAPQSVIECDHINFSYHQTAVLEDISCRIEAGDYVGILGPNGSGKTTLLKIMLGLIKPTSGEMRLFGEVRPGAAARRRIGYVPQHVTQGQETFPATVEEVVLSGRTAARGLRPGWSKADRQAAAEAVELLDLTHLRHRLIGELSGGQRQRVFIARALAGDPEILVLDEPTIGVDIASQQVFYDFLKQLNTERGLTILFVSHDIDVIAQEASSVLCVNRRLVCHVPARDLIGGDVLQQLYGEKGKYILHRH